MSWMVWNWIFAAATIGAVLVFMICAGDTSGDPQDQ